MNIDFLDNFRSCSLQINFNENKVPLAPSKTRNINWSFSIFCSYFFLFWIWNRCQKKCLVFWSSRSKQCVKVEFCQPCIRHKNFTYKLTIAMGKWDKNPNATALRSEDINPLTLLIRLHTTYGMQYFIWLWKFFMKINLVFAILLNLKVF